MHNCLPPERRPSARRAACSALALVIASLTLAPLMEAQYAGPSMLSRGGNRPGHRGRAPVDFTFYGSVRGLYETGLVVPAVADDEGRLPTASGWGTLAEFGLYGGHDWRRTSIGIDYRGDYRYMPVRPRRDGTNHAVTLQLQNRLSRRGLLMLSATGGTTNRAFGAFAAPTFGDINRLGVPLSEVFDVRLYYAQTGAMYSYQKSARTSFGIGADGFFVKRENLSLINGQGYRGLGSVQHRLDRLTTINATYQFLRFEFPRVYSDANSHGVSAGINRRLGRDWEADAQGGIYLVSVTGIEQVTLSPEIAAILGRPVGQQAFSRSKRAPLIQATLARMFGHGRAYVSATSGIMPGNGIYLTTGRNTVSAGVSYAGIRRFSMGVSGGYSRQTSIGLELPGLSLWQVGGGGTYKLARNVSLMSQIDYRTFDTRAIQGRQGFVMSFGLALSPTPLPISIW
jgi:hypothetical protein